MLTSRRMLRWKGLDLLCRLWVTGASDALSPESEAERWKLAPPLGRNPSLHGTLRLNGFKSKQICTIPKGGTQPKKKKKRMTFHPAVSPSYLNCIVCCWILVYLANALDFVLPFCTNHKQQILNFCFFFFVFFTLFDIKDVTAWKQRAAVAGGHGSQLADAS